MADTPAQPRTDLRGRLGGRWVRLFVRQPPVGGLIGAVLFYSASLTPSLLPRPWQVQAVVSGVALALGYGLGSGLDALVRPRSNRADYSSMWLRTVLATLGLLTIAAAILIHWRWQSDVRRLMDMEPGVGLYLALAVVAGILVGYLLVVGGRAARAAVAAYLRFLRRFMPSAAAVLVALATLSTIGIVGFDVLIADRLVLALDRGYMASYLRFDADVSRPDSPYRSGSPASLVDWEGMGRQGRAFVTQGPDLPELEEFNGEPARMPIRVYTGLQTAETIRERAELAAAELDRAGAFDREVLVLVTPTGTGWVDPYAVDPLEYLYNGDTAAVVVQYSHRPSWMVMIGNQDEAIEASRSLFAAVTRRLEEVPESNRPAILLYGESLGSFGWEAIFDDFEEVRRRTDGALWVGPPRSNRLWRQLIADRRPDSPLWRPIYGEGETVRFGPDGAALSAVPGPWLAPRVVYLQHASDPITWLSFDLLVRRPEWLGESRGPDVSKHMPYIPVVTFWQMVVDLVMGTNAPIGHGHKFGPAQAEAWTLILPPPGWTDDATQQLVARVERGVDSEE